MESVQVEMRASGVALTGPCRLDRKGAGLAWGSTECGFLGVLQTYMKGGSAFPRYGIRTVLYCSLELPLHARKRLPHLFSHLFLVQAWDWTGNGDLAKTIGYDTLRLRVHASVQRQIWA